MVGPNPSPGPARPPNPWASVGVRGRSGFVARLWPMWPTRGPRRGPPPRCRAGPGTYSPTSSCRAEDTISIVSPRPTRPRPGPRDATPPQPPLDTSAQAGSSRVLENAESSTDSRDFLSCKRATRSRRMIFGSSRRAPRCATCRAAAIRLALIRACGMTLKTERLCRDGAAYVASAIPVAPPDALSSC